LDVSTEEEEGEEGDLLLESKWCAGMPANSSSTAMVVLAASSKVVAKAKRIVFVLIEYIYIYDNETE
jgi:hypothetical protein